MSDITKIAEELGKLTILEAAELVKNLEEEWGVSAAPAAGVAVAAPADGGGAADANICVRFGRKRDKIISNLNRRPHAVHQRLYACLTCCFRNVDKLIDRACKRIECV